jgi:hypothetical protein
MDDIDGDKRLTLGSERALAHREMIRDTERLVRRAGLWGAFVAGATVAIISVLVTNPVLTALLTGVGILVAGGLVGAANGLSTTRTRE